ncbi:hypothetical protein THOM_0317 [Trachipleistophora hominis]|uniref:Transport protein particle (TRAPP) complex subunit n=1 Tax=Trachipleistophora hominis TaxID=72359 RepID=L7K0C6_TRAHO|nr:hypothetical protein THOM_0317 [Trachipleistophora hominis]
MINNKFYIAFLEETIQKHDYDCESIGLALARLFPNPYGKDGVFNLDKYFLVTIWKMITYKEVFEVEMENGICVIGSCVPPLYDSFRHCREKYLARLDKLLSMYANIIRGYLRGCKIKACVEIDHDSFLYLKVKQAKDGRSRVLLTETATSRVCEN